MPPAFLNLSNDKRDAVKRLIKVGDSYVCGICRSSHSDKNRAMACLERCASGYFADQNPKDKPKGTKTLYRCKFCCRNYESRQSALACLRNCRQQMQNRFDSEHYKASVGSLIDINKATMLTSFADKNLILEACAELLSHPVAKKHRPKSSVHVCIECGQSYGSAREVEACRKVHALDKKSQSITTESVVGGSAEEKAIRKVKETKARPVEGPIIEDSITDIKASDKGEEAMPDLVGLGDFESQENQIESASPHDSPADQGTHDNAQEDMGIDPFYEKAMSLDADSEKKKYARKDARYECRACLERYFTKKEVLDCFDKHLNGGPKS